ncbi:MAG: cytidine deaminase [Chloroflexota bacterium]|nr:cytidine deaminase [Chloroflexota bacterium]
MNDRSAQDIDLEVPELRQKLVDSARVAAQNAYVPYSHFPVGAAVLTGGGDIVCGANIENASLGLTVCGERVAIQTAAAMGHRSILAIAVSAPRAAETMPCGACRQVMNEFRPAQGELLVLIDCHDSITDVPLSELLPKSFGPRDLERAH